MLGYTASSYNFPDLGCLVPELESHKLGILLSCTEIPVHLLHLQVEVKLWPDHAICASQSAISNRLFLRCLQC